MRTIAVLGSALAMAIGLASCGKSPTNADRGAKVAPGTLTIVGTVAGTAVGQTFQLKASVTSSTQEIRDVTASVVWASTDPAIATISTAGLVTIVGLGIGGISATYGSLVATKQVTALPPAVGLTLTGNVALSAVGETSQLRAVATLPGGGTADVTNLATWVTATIPSVVRVSKGLVTADALGWGQVNATYSSSVAFTPVTVTPPGTYVVRGFVRLPGHAGVAGFRVVDTVSGRSVISTSTGPYSPGWYSLGGLTGSTRLAFDKVAYEPAELVVNGPSPNGGGDVKVQQLYRIAAGGTVQTTIAPHDVDYAVSPAGSCVNCRMIRVVCPATGTLHLSLNWNLPPVSLGVWINGQFFAGPQGGPLAVDVPVGAGELVMYVGVIAGNLGDGDESGRGGAGVTMTLTTSLTVPESGAPRRLTVVSASTATAPGRIR